MALGILLIMFIVIGVVCVVSIASLYLVKDPQKNTVIFVITAGLGILISYLNFTSLASNLVAPRIVAIVFGILAVIGLILKYKHGDFAAKLFVTASVVLGIVQLYFL